MRVGVEVGGTFTDLVAIGSDGIRVTKVPSVPRAPDEGAFNALVASKIPLGEITDLAHGSTVATNAEIRLEPQKETRRILTPHVGKGVLNVKISEPVKLTTDESKSLVRETSMKDLKPNREDKLSLPLDDVDGDLPADLLGSTMSTADKAVVGAVPELSNYPREMMMRVALQALDSKTTSGSSSYSGRAEMNNFMLGMEFYFTSKEKWYAQFSLLPYFQYQYQHKSAHCLQLLP